MNNDPLYVVIAVEDGDAIDPTPIAAFADVAKANTYCRDVVEKWRREVYDDFNATLAASGDAPLSSSDDPSTLVERVHQPDDMCHEWRWESASPLPHLRFAVRVAAVEVMS